MDTKSCLKNNIIISKEATDINNRVPIFIRFLDEENKSLSKKILFARNEIDTESYLKNNITIRKKQRV